MLQQISIENFKALKHVVVEPKTLTVLIGPNGSGKSSVFQALGVLKQSVGRGQLQTDGPYAPAGTYEDLAHKGGKRANIKFSLAVLADAHSVVSVFNEAVPVRYDSAFDEAGIVSHSLDVHAHGRTFQCGWSREGPMSDSVWDFGSGRWGATVRGDRSVASPAVLKIVNAGALEKDEADLAKKAVNDLVSVVSACLATVTIIPASRGFEEPLYLLVDNPVDDLLATPQGITRAQQLASTLVYQRPLAKRVAGLVNQVVGGEVAAGLVPPKKVALEAPRRDWSVNVVNEGFGLNQLIWLFFQTAAAPHGAVVAIEEPEIHLHPRAQGSLVDALVQLALDEDKQLMLATHSEHILLRLLTAVAEGKLKPDDVSVYYFEQRDGVATAKRLEVNRSGAIEGGLKGFFEVGMEEMGRYLGALSKEGGQ